MKKLVLKTTVEVYSDLTELSKTDQALILLARASLQDSYSPYSKFQVGAGLLLDNGKMIGGSNQENASYPLCLCAERVALAAAAAQYPQTAILTIAVTAKNQKMVLSKPISPCGACRQVICETEQKHQQTIRILLQGEEGDIYAVNGAQELLPLSFDSSSLFLER